ncbi:MAG: Fic family protein [Rhodospirillales bacterium]|nr:Fic family protein [Rhodospirillales bacterium]
MSDTNRHSKALEPEIITDPDEKARVEAANGLRQYDEVRELVRYWTIAEAPKFRLRPSTLLGLQRTALQGLSSYAGNFRPASIEIGDSKHTPPGAHLVPELVEEMCDYINDNWNDKTAVHLAAYVMWRLNWIHPFVDGNGRTSRAASYLVLCVKSGYLLPGDKTIPEQITDNRQPYYDALEAADECFQKGAVDLTAMEELLSAALATQLVDYHKSATGPTSPPN